MGSCQPMRFFQQPESEDEVMKSEGEEMKVETTEDDDTLVVTVEDIPGFGTGVFVTPLNGTLEDVKREVHTVLRRVHEDNWEKIIPKRFPRHIHLTSQTKCPCIFP